MTHKQVSVQITSRVKLLLFELYFKICSLFLKNLDDKDIITQSDQSEIFKLDTC